VPPRSGDWDAPEDGQAQAAEKAADQVIIIVFLALGFWLVGNSLYYIVT
jgi:hypothetical protein